MFALKTAYEQEKAAIIEKEEEKNAKAAEKTEKSEKSSKAEKAEATESPLHSMIPFPIITPKTEVEKKEEDVGIFTGLRSYFSQKKSPFEGYEKAVDILEGFVSLV